MFPLDLTHIAGGDILAFAAPVALLVFLLWLMRRDEEK